MSYLTDSKNICVNLRISGFNLVQGENNCFSHCGHKSGKCTFCDVDGLNGYCCRNNYFKNGDCPHSAILSAPKNQHGCVHSKGKINNLNESQLFF